MSKRMIQKEFEKWFTNTYNKPPIPDKKYGKLKRRVYFMQRELARLEGQLKETHSYFNLKHYARIAYCSAREKDNKELIKRLEELEQTSACLCVGCGWRMKFPGRACRNCGCKEKGRDE